MSQIFLMLISFTGYYSFMYCLFRGKKLALYPSLLVSLITVCGFFAGLADHLLPVYNLLYWTGFALIGISAIYIFKSFPKLNKPSVNALFPLIIFYIGSIVMYFIFNDRFLHHYDDFSHWGKIARIIATDMRFPVNGDQLSHGSYPPGSALFIAYISNITRNSQDIYLYSQALMLLSFWISLLIAGKNLLSQILLSLFIYLLMQFNVSTEILSVDNLLAASAFSCIIICLSGTKQRRTNFIPLSIALSSLILIKNSSTVFVFLIFLYAVFLYIKARHKLTFKFIPLFLPFLILLFWNRYVDHTFIDQQKHQMSAAYYSQILCEKNASDIIYILKLFLQIMITPQRNLVLYLIPVYLLIFAAYKKQNKLSKNYYILSFSVIILFVYEAGILLMYIFSMPMKEILVQNGNDFDRYNNTLTAILIGIQLYLTCSLRIAKGIKKKIRGAFLSFITIFVSIVIAMHVLILANAHFRTMEYRIARYETAYHFSQMQEKLDEIEPNSSHIILLCENQSSGDYQKHIARYYLRSKDIAFCYDKETALELSKSENWRYFIDLCEEIICEPASTVGKELFSSTVSSEYTNILNQVGYKENTRYSVSSKSDVTAYNWDITGYIPAKAGDTIRLHNITWYPSSENDALGGFIWFSKDMSFKSHKRDILTKEDLINWNPVFDEKQNIIQITIPREIGSAEYIRIVCQDITSESIVTINQEII